MGKKKNSFDLKSLKVAMIACLMLVLPVLAGENTIIVANNDFAIQNGKNISFKAEHKPSTSNSCIAYFKGTLSVNDCRAGEVPMPAATWLFVLALAAFVGLSNKRKI